MMYQLRGMSFEQIYNYFFKERADGKIGSESYCRKVVSKLLNEDKFIEKTSINGKIYYQVTTKGINQLKISGIKEIGDDNSRFLTADEYKTARNIFIKEKVITHQINLNEFVLRFWKKNFPLSWYYRDDKFINQYFVGFRPDGLIKVEDYYYLLEMDMNTETKKHLVQKWERYQSIILQGTIGRMGRIRILFILCEEMDIPKREEEVLETIQYSFSQYLDKDSLDMYIGSSEQLLQTMEYELTDAYLYEIERDYLNSLEEYGFVISDGSEIELQNVDYYIRKRDEDGNILKMDHSLVEYLLLDYRQKKCSVVKAVKDYGHLSNQFKQNYGRMIKMLIVLSDNMDIPDLLKKETLYEPNIYFTTEKRLRNSEFLDAIFQFKNE